MAGVIVRFENGNLPYESWQALDALAIKCALEFDCVESNPNGLFIHYGGLDTEESAINVGEAIRGAVPCVESVEASPCL